MGTAYTLLVILGLLRGNIGVILGLYMENGKNGVTILYFGRKLKVNRVACKVPSLQPQACNKWGGFLNSEVPWGSI